jgi:hypothetical protein
LNPNNLKKLVGSALVALSLLLGASTASAQHLMTANEELPVSAGTTIQFATEWDYANVTICDVVFSFTQTAIIHNPGDGGDTIRRRVFVETRVPTGRLYDLVPTYQPEGCSGFLYEGMVREGTGVGSSRVTSPDLGFLMSFPIQLWSVLLFQ